MSFSWLILVLQVAAGTIASFMVGMIWFSSYGLGRVWWRYTFPNKKYGECTGPAVGYGIRKRERERERERAMDSEKDSVFVTVY